MNPAKELNNLLDNCQETLNWAGSMRKYLGEMVETIERLKLVSEKKKQKRIYREAYRNFRYALRCARRINRYYGKIKEALKELKPALGVPLREQINAIEQRLRPHEAAVIAESSFFRGRLNDDLNALEARIVTKTLTSRQVDAVKAEINQLIAEDRKSIGLVPFMIEVRNLQTLMAGVQRGARRMVA